MPNTAPFPHHYRVHLDAEARLSAGPRTVIAGGVPAEFGGDELHWGPEHLLMGAASLCLMTTAQAIARREALELVSYECDVEGILEKTAAGLVFTSIVLAVALTVRAGSEERAEQLLQTAKKHCIVANALKCPITLKPTVRAA